MYIIDYHDMPKKYPDKHYIRLLFTEITTI